MPQQRRVMKTLASCSRGSFVAACAVIAWTWSGCATITGVLDPQAATDVIAFRARFVRATIPTRTFQLVTYARLNMPGQPVTVYIEGDGRAWRSKHRLSNDPTPLHPLVMELAARDPSPNVAYVARPCQYVQDDRCDSAYWSDRRFSEEVIASMDEAIDVLVRRGGEGRIHLVGYSGGAAVAALLAARRSDIVSLRTIAGNLDPAAVNAFHAVSPLSGSLDPIEVASRLASLPQRHFIGRRDTIIPPFIAKRFVRALGDRRCAGITVVDAADHSTGWAARWAGLLQVPVVCGE